MLKSHFVEDIFCQFYNTDLLLQTQDARAAESFFNVIVDGKQLTQNQANFILKILQKYQGHAKRNGLDYSLAITNPQWKTKFRVLDLSKKVHVQKDENGELWVCLRFPYQLKDEFEKQILPLVKALSNSKWDPEERIRMIRLYDYNLIEVHEFCVKHNFEMAQSFLEAVSTVEQIWSNQEEIFPVSTVVNNRVELRNCNEDTINWWKENSTGDVDSDLLLAKSMGYPYNAAPLTTVEKIAAAESNQFWLKTNVDFFNLYNKVNGNVAVMVGKNETSQDWVKQFVHDAKLLGIPAKDIRVCFRMSKEENSTGFNQWVKDNELGGPVEGAKIFIFQNKPPKWLFSDAVPVKIIVTDSLFPIPSSTTQTWMKNHSCVCFVGEIKASNIKDRQIVEL